VLSRALADQGHYPAIDIESSVSRTLTSLADAAQLGLVRRFKSTYSLYQRNRDLITVGAYSAGTDPAIDQAIALQPAMQSFLQQDIGERAPYVEAQAHLGAVLADNLYQAN
jgi:flagellum-specific ATP synthase